MKCASLYSEITKDKANERKNYTIRNFIIYGTLHLKRGTRW